MKEKFKGFLVSKKFIIGVCSLIFLIIGVLLYQFFIQIGIQNFWMIIPIAISISAILLCKIIRQNHISPLHILTSGLISLLFLFLSIKFEKLLNFILFHLESISVISVALFFIMIICLMNNKTEKNISNNDADKNKLFNLFYINTSKSHEIAMLIDNKIMKTIEREQVSEKILKRSTNFSASKKDNLYAEAGISTEDSSKQSVYENFDVKNTKSIMLRKIYETAQKNKKGLLKEGNLIIFENIELNPRNIDDTVMILNILQDSKLKNQGNDAIEINLNKMMDKMLDDFTIDYTFSCTIEGNDNNEYIIQIPYKSIDNFENGYRHNDLQLGKLSIIGIYRGEIDFSNRDSISSKFLDLMSESFKQETAKKEDEVIMKLSEAHGITPNIPFEFSHKKILGKYHLIDVIAIIQELNFDKDE